MISAVTIILTLLYCCFILWCLFHWERIHDRSHVVLRDQNICIAVVIATRNESENIESAINNFIRQDYPSHLCELIICDDHSEDNTFLIAEAFIKKNAIPNVRVIRSGGSYKKEAIEQSVKLTNAELIITTDCDTKTGSSWLSSVVNAWQSSDAVLICSPVMIVNDGGLFGKIQSTEFPGLVGIAAAGIHSRHPMICNGANLAFSKKAFEDVGGYSGSGSVSGDDTQLMLKMHERFPGRSIFLKDQRAIARTNAMTSISSLIHQRNRWASKIPRTLSSFTVSIAVLAWLVHVFLLIQLVTYRKEESLVLLLFPWIIKSFCEILFIRAVTQFFKTNSNWLIVICIQPFYCCYIILTGLLSPIVKFSWRGRKI